ncbi:cytidylyltransferase domain-containing protein [Lederbergia citrea]|uniref:Acylneuraminate cytidylyltransferase family protein n=1 Tax=Lederbergia citrea TaxID=2833581 RepID=A0A942UTF9_9BACI|nr:acylneuraminate cytidylyltransferase family protein [Lederbergia citrea]MBS4205795.1 acylneuraminate cytidylyltransferase family protein [Lederbergia citrea]MBS4224756.1 acylneuraminate cytidylyltransferase family protein [Lederbergia citrea]
MKKRVVAFVPIKLNSQRLAKKNILPLGDHSLSWYVFNTLLGIEEIDEVCVFCSDERIMDYIPIGVKFVQRDPYLDGDMVKGNEIYESFINTVDSDIYLLAHTTSPLMRQRSIENALNNVLSESYDSALSVQKKQTFAWYKGQTLNYESNDIPRTQDIEPIYIETSGFYIFKKEHFLAHRRRVGFYPYFQELDDIEAIDIDTNEDYEFALMIMNKNKIPLKI